MSIGTNIRKRRFELNMSQAELAKALGYKTKSTIAKIESGENGVSVSKLQAFARALDTTIDALLSGTDTSSSPEPRTAHFLPGSKVIAVILAGGKSSRNLQNIPNQFVTVLGKPVIIYSMEAYERHPAVSEIYVVCLKGWEDILASYAEEYGITKLAGIIPGGDTGIRSIKNAVDRLETESDDDVLILQESTRPMVTDEIISKLLPVCKESGNAVTSEPMDGIVQFFVEEERVRYLNRNMIVEAQSPDAYRLGLLREAFRTGEKRGAKLEESCAYMFLYNLGFPLKFVEGNHNNLKIIRQEDVAIFNALLKAGR